MIKNEAEIDKDEIDDTLSLIDNELAVAASDNKTTEIAEKKNPEYSIDDLIGTALDSMKKIDKKTDELYDMFYAPLATRSDRSDASKIAILDTQHVKTDMLQAIAQLANAKAKEEAAKQKASGVGVIVQTKSGEDVGINLGNIS